MPIFSNFDGQCLPVRRIRLQIEEESKKNQLKPEAPVINTPSSSNKPTDAIDQLRKGDASQAIKQTAIVNAMLVNNNIIKNNYQEAGRKQKFFLSFVFFGGKIDT